MAKHLSVLTRENWVPGVKPDYKIYTFDKTKLLTFLEDLIDFVEMGTNGTVTVNVGNYVRRMYPGGPPIAVEAHQRIRSLSPGERGTTTLPGKPFYIETQGEVGGILLKKVVFQNTYTGSWRKLRQDFTGNYSGPAKIRRESGQWWKTSG